MALGSPDLIGNLGGIDELNDVDLCRMPIMPHRAGHHNSIGKRHHEDLHIYLKILWLFSRVLWFLWIMDCQPHM
jgi:hypothetical protein